MLRAIVALLIAVLLPSAAHAEKRLALLIGNQSYSPEIGKLANPHNDIALLEKALKGLKFEVATVRDAGLGSLHQAVNAHARRVRAAGPNAIALFYYAGHGAADAGTNYLIPVDVKSAEEGELWDVSMRLTEITRKLKTEAGNATHFIIFDACRNNLKLRAAGTRALVQSRGFEPVPQEIGMLIAYATAEGELASDVGAGAGPYASALAEEMVKPGVEAVEMFRRVQRRVRAAIKQEPYLGFNALGDVYLAGLAPDLPKTAVAPPPPAPLQPQGSEAVERAWGLVKDTTDVRSLEAFRRQYGATNPFFDRLAEARIEYLNQTGEVAKRKADDEVRAKAEAERQRLARLQQEEEAKRAQAASAKVAADAAKKKADDDTRAKAEVERQRLAMLEQERKGVAPLGAVDPKGYPARSLKIIVPFAAGGPTDTSARRVGEHLQMSLRQSLFIENRVGDSGTIGAAEGAKATPDGYTLLMVSNLHAINATLLPNRSYNLMRDFVPVAPVSSSDLIMAIGASVPAKDLKELIALLKAKPGRHTYASTGHGSPSHLAGELFGAVSGTKIVHVPYKGSYAAINDVLSGQVDMIFGAIISIAPFVRDGKMRAIGISGKRRSALLPDLPTLSEAGLPGHEVADWTGLMTPAGTPQPIVAKLNAEITKLLERREVMEAWSKEGAVPIVMSPAEFGTFLQAEIEKWAEVIRTSGIKAQ